MKSVLISIQPKWCELIASGKKLVEVRKTRPKIDTPFKCYIYQTKLRWVYSLLHALGFYAIARRLSRGAGKVIGEFICDEIKQIHCQSIEKEAIYAIAIGNGDKEYYDNSCVSYKEAYRYLRNVKKAYGWHISDFVIYDEPKGIHHFFKSCGDCDKKGTRRCTEELTDCRAKVITRPPQSWCYVEG